jgi:hypothetical protein
MRVGIGSAPGLRTEARGILPGNRESVADEMLRQDRDLYLLGIE